MKKIVVSETGTDCSHIAYVYHSLNAELPALSTEYHLTLHYGEVRLIISCDDSYYPDVKKCVISACADIIGIGYKYAYLKDCVDLSAYSDYNGELLLTALISADFAEEKKYILRRLTFGKILCIDGFFRFRLRELKEKWSQITELLPEYFSPYEFEKFIGFLIEGENKKIYVKDNEVFDERYKKLRRSRLIGSYPEFSFLREIVLSGADNICCLTPVNGEESSFLKKYYPSKVFFD